MSCSIFAMLEYSLDGGKTDPGYAWHAGPTIRVVRNEHLFTVLGNTHNYKENPIRCISDGRLEPFRPSRNKGNNLLQVCSKEFAEWLGDERSDECPDYWGASYVTLEELENYYSSRDFWDWNAKQVQHHFDFYGATVENGIEQCTVMLDPIVYDTTILIYKMKEAYREILCKVTSDFYIENDAVRLSFFFGG